MSRRARLMQHKPLKRSPLSPGSDDTGQGAKTRQRSNWTPKRRDTGPTRKVRELVKTRDSWRCVRCGIDVHGIAHNIQHRRARGQGGTSRPDTNLAGNLILLCGTPLTLCHGHVEQHRHEAMGNGWAIPLEASNPAAWPVTTHDRGRIYLDDDGGWRSA